MSSTDEYTFNGNHALSLFIYLVVGVLSWYGAILINQVNEPVGIIVPTTKQSIAIIFIVFGSLLVWGKMYFVFSK